MLVASSDLKVAPDGDYVLGTFSSGVRVFSPQGTFVRQYGDGGSGGVTFVPGNRIWAGGAGTTVRVFDTDTGAQVGSFTANGQVNSGGLRYYANTNSVLMVDSERDGGGVFERDLSGNLLRQYHVSYPQTAAQGAVQMPDGDIYGTHGLYAPPYPDLVHWSADGTVLEEKAIWPVQILPGEILWAGAVPEPSCATGVTGTCVVIFCWSGRQRATTARRAWS
jgi:hypothetical protein